MFTTRWLALLTKPLRNWGPALALSAVFLVSTAIVVSDLRASPVSPVRPILVSSGSWAPYVGPELPKGGPMTELITEILKRAGYAPQVSYASWTLAREQVISGAAQGVYPLVKSTSRLDQFLSSDPLIEFEYVLFYDRSRGEPRVSSAAELSRLRVGGISGYDYWPELESTVRGLVEFNTAEEGFQALADGKIDLLAEGLLSGQATVADPSFPRDANDFDHLRDGGKLVHSVEGLHFMMPKTPEAAAVMRKFNEVLTAMRKGQEYKAIVAALQPDAAQEVALEPVGGAGLAELLDETGRTVLYAPRGTRAKVLAWPKEFTEKADPAPERILVEVKIINGPASGRALYVDARALLLEVPGQ
ncbi:transporter substrate-binding domain-containing protein [Actinocorallia aurantiaca]